MDLKMENVNEWHANRTQWKWHIIICVKYVITKTKRGHKRIR